MANKFIPWIDEVEPGTTTQEQSVFADDSQRLNGFIAGNPASAIRVNSALRQANVVVAALMQLADELVTLPDLDLNSTVANITAALKASIITPLTTRLTNLETSFEEISGDAASLGQRITTLESEMDAVQSKNTEQDSSISAVDEKVDTHIERTDNPHSVTKEQVGLGSVDNVKQYSASNPPPYPVRSVAGKTGAVTLTKSDVGLSNVDNTSDEDKPVSTAMQTALNGKANTSGTYPNLTAGQATNATKLNNKSASEYALASDIPDASKLVPDKPDLSANEQRVLSCGAYFGGDDGSIKWRRLNTPNSDYVYIIGVSQNATEFSLSGNGLKGWMLLVTSVEFNKDTFWSTIYDKYRYEYIPFIGKFAQEDGTQRPIYELHCIAGGSSDDPRLVFAGPDWGITVDTKDYDWAYSISKLSAIPILG